jgi:enhancing lycopene biosynthesis protein 2
MKNVGLYFSGNGSLDGSDVMSGVLAHKALQESDLEPVPIARDLSQGEVINHRTARKEDDDRNSLDEAARITRGDIRGMRDVDVDHLDGAMFVGGGGTLSTWTDFKERGSDCRVTERLQFQVIDLFRDDKPLLALDNAGFALGFILKDTVNSLTINPGSNPRLRETLSEWNLTLSEESLTWDEQNRVGCLPDLTREADLEFMEKKIQEILKTSSLI